MAITFESALKKDKQLSEYTKVIIDIYPIFYGSFEVKIGRTQYDYDSKDFPGDYPDYNRSGVIKKYEEMLLKLTHDEKLRYLYSIAHRYTKEKPEALVVVWLKHKIEEEEAVSFNLEFEFSGKKNEETIAELKEKLKKAESDIADLNNQLSRSEKKNETLIEERGCMENEPPCKFAFKEKGKTLSVELSLREKIVIMAGIMRMSHNDKDEELSANLKRLISNGNTVGRYLKYMKSDGDRPLTDKEKENIRRFYKEEKLDTAYILDYIN